MGKSKIWENVIIFVLIGIAIIFITPIIQGIFLKSQISSAKIGVETVVKFTKVLYERHSLDREVLLPFMIEIQKDGKYDLYEKSSKIATGLALDIKGEKPLSGRVIIDRDGAVYARNVEFRNAICNMEKDEVVVCARKQ